MLICKFASPRSHPQRIRDWLAYLERLAEKHGDDHEARRTLEGLMHQGQSWLARQVRRDSSSPRVA
jgi:hypothetical protein